MKLLVLGGGTSPEREISLQSAQAVREALVHLGHEVAYLDPVEGDAAVLGAAEAADLILPILHGAGGEDGEIQALLGRAGKPFLGSGVEASQRCFDKVIFKEFLLEHGLPTPAFAVVSRATIEASPLLAKPHVLKPILGGSSIDLVLERQPAGITPAVEACFSRHHELLLEELISGTEITAPVLDGRALPVVEIIPPQGKAFDYENKYNGATTELCPPQHLSADLQKRIQALAEQIYELAGLRHLARIDMMIKPDGEQLYILEANTLPGMTATSLYPKSAAAAGLPFNDLVAQFVELVAAKTSLRGVELR